MNVGLIDIRRTTSKGGEEERVMSERPAGPVGNSVSGAKRTDLARQLVSLLGRRPSKRMAKWFRAAFQPTFGIVHFFDASLQDRPTETSPLKRAERQKK